MALTKEEVLKYLSDIRSHYAQYHNHKEASAWAAAAVYIALVIQISYSVPEQSFCLMSRVLAIILIIFLGILVCFFLSVQFGMRRDAANYVAACIELTSKYLRDESKINPDDFVLVPPTNKKDKANQSSFVLPKVILYRVKDLKKVGQGARRDLDCIIYTIIIIVALAAWFRLLYLA